MNRRSFLGTLVGGIAATAAVRTWPFRVFSFPAEIKFADWTTLMRAEISVGSILSVRIPQRFITKFTGETFLFLEKEITLARSGEIGKCFGFEFDKETNLFTKTC
jgi:hypothetical protein